MGNLALMPVVMFTGNKDNSKIEHKNSLFYKKSPALRSLIISAELLENYLQ